MSVISLSDRPLRSIGIENKIDILKEGRTKDRWAVVGKGKWR